MKNKFLLLLSALVLSIGSICADNVYHQYSPVRCELFLKSGSTSQWEVDFVDSDGDDVWRAYVVNMGSNYNINGQWTFSSNSNNLCYRSNGNQFLTAGFTGSLWLEYAGFEDGDYPVYFVYMYSKSTGSQNACYYMGFLPVRAYSGSNTSYPLISLKNTSHSTETYTYRQIPGSQNLKDYVSSESYWQIAGEDEFNYQWAFMPDEVSSLTGRVRSTNTYANGCYKKNQTTEEKTIATSSAAYSVYKNGFYFFTFVHNFASDGMKLSAGHPSDHYFISMQYPNYQAVDNAYSETFDWDDVTLTRRADFATSGVVTLTATNASNKKVVLDFVVDVDEVGTIGDIVIPAGDYTVSTSETTGTVIASGGINTDLTVKNSYAGTTTALTSSNYSTNPLWCLISGTVTVGADQSVTVVANQSYRGSPVNITINGPVIEGSFAVNYGVSPAGAGSITSATYGDAPGTSFNSGAELDGGTSITLTAGNNSGYRFDRWSNGVTNNPLTFMLIKDTTLTAQFIKTYVITATSSVGGSATGTGTYDVNAQATLTAITNNEHLYFFDHWELGGSPIAGGATITPTVTADATYTAIFRVASDGTISATADHGTVSGTGDYNGGDEVTLSVTADDGYFFMGWDDNNDGVVDHTDNPRTVYVDGNKDYTALFAEGTRIYVEDGVLYVSNSGSGYFFFEGKSSDNYCFHFETKDTPFAEGEFSGSAIDQNYTKLYYPAYSTQIGVNFSTLTASVSKEYVTATMYKYVLSAIFQDTEGNVYDATIKAIGPMKADCVSAMDNTTIEANDAFSTDVKILTMSDNRYRLRADGGNWSGMSYGYDTRIDFIISDDDMTDAVPPVGTYPITYTLDSKTVAMPEYPNLTCSSSYDLSSLNTAFNGSIMRQFYLNSGANISQMWWKFLCGGTVSVTKVGSTYTYAISAITSKADPNNTYPASYYTVNYYVSGSTYSVVLAAEDENGNSISNGAPVYVAYNRDYGKHFVPGTYNFFSNAEIKLVASDNAAYEFVKWKDNDSEEGARTETVTGASSYTAVFRSNATPRTITLSSDANGTVTVHNENTNADVVFTENTASVLDGTTLTISAEGNTGYHCTGITINDEPLVGSTYTVAGDFTIAATFAANTHTVSWVTDGNALTGTYTDGTTAYGTTIVAPEMPTKDATAEYTYAFDAWSPAVDATMPDNDVEYIATWTETPVNYTLTWSTDGDALTGTYTSGETAFGTTIVAPATPTKDGFTFVGWTPAVAETMPAANTTYTATWAQNFELIDDKYTGDDYYTTTLPGKVGQTLSVRYIREFPANQWAAFSLPFGYSFQKDGNNTFKDQVYYLISAEYEVEGGKAYLTLNCMPNTLGIVANKPYILIPNETITNPVFNNVKMKAQALNYYSVPCTNIGVADPVETVEFRNTLTRMPFENNDHRQIYLVNNRLHYPNNGTYIRAFRGYFYMQEGTIQHIQPRLRNAETGEIIEAAEEANTTGVETKKYIENGILLIERNGIKYDAQGHIIK